MNKKKIFITLGSQKFQFNRLLKKIDELIKIELEEYEVFAQIGYSDYTPLYYDYKYFLDRNEFLEKLDQSDIVITHGGTGAIVGAVKKGKKVIAVPRLEIFNEHVDDHQLQIVNQFQEMTLIDSCIDFKELYYKIQNIDFKKFSSYKSNTNEIIKSIDLFIETIK